MTKFLNKQAKTFWGKSLNIVITLVLAIGVALLNTKVIYPNLYEQAQFFQYTHPLWISFIEGCIMAPLAEELLFRYFPLQFARVMSKRLIIPTILFSSVIFGLMHYGFPSLPLQGVLGFLLCVLYIKNGWSYWSVVIVHSLYNLAVTFVL